MELSGPGMHKLLMARLHALPALLFTVTLAANGPWHDYAQRRKGADPRTARWILCVRQADFTQLEAYGDPVLQRLFASGDFALETLPPAVARDLWKRRDWGEAPHWLLLSPAGEEAAHGRGKPRGGDVLDGIHAVGKRTRWEAREAFLKEHPDQGEARMEALQQAFTLARLRLTVLDKQGKIRIPAWHQDLAARSRFTRPRISVPADAPADLVDPPFDELAGALERLLELPGWETEATSLASQLGQWDLSGSLRLRKLFAKASAGLEEYLRREPYDAGIAHFWVEATDAAGRPLGNLSGLCQALPGQPWPEPDALHLFLEPSFRRSDWESALKLIADLTPNAAPVPPSAAGWESYKRLQGALLAQRAMAFGGLGSWDLATSSLTEARTWIGGQGVRVALLQRGGLFSGPGPEPSPWRHVLAQATQGRDPEPPPAPAAEPPLRLVVGGMPRWILAWTALRDTQELAQWGPEELHWEVASPAEFEALRMQQGWEPGPRWTLWQGEELLASGRSCPEARALASVLESAGPSMLQRLQQVLASQPDHLAAHWERFRLLERRMPNPRLEPLMAQDAAAALAPLDFEPGAPWKPNADVWAGAAQEVLPRIEANLRSWPTRAHLWRAWISWARFHPSHPSVLTLVQSLAFWSPRGDWRAWLPFEVQRTVAGELRRQGDYTLMRQWYRAVWDTLDRRPLANLHRGERPWVLERRKEEETAVFQPLRDALAALRCTAELADLEREFGEMIGRTPTRRH
jgi:hypothetical protein